MSDTCKLTKLVDRLQRFSTELEKIKDLNVHQRINQFYYMQKKAELLVLSDQLEETRKRLSQLAEFLEKEYTSVVSQWINDIRWLRTYQMIHQN
jgi:hypothetical protein